MKSEPPERTGVAEFVSRVFGSHNPQLHRYLRRMLGSREAAEEVAQETYTKLFRLCRPEDVRFPKALLFTMASRQALDYLEAQRLKGRFQAADINEVPDVAPHPEKQAALDESMRHLRMFIAQMRPRYRQVFVLRYYKQLSYQEIADLLNISADAAQQRAATAAQECRSKFAALGIDPLTLD